MKRKSNKKYQRQANRGSRRFLKKHLFEEVDSNTVRKVGRDKCGAYVTTYKGAVEYD